jgi:hypothetical protein
MYDGVLGLGLEGRPKSWTAFAYFPRPRVPQSHHNSITRGRDHDNCLVVHTNSSAKVIEGITPMLSLKELTLSRMRRKTSARKRKERRVELFRVRARPQSQVSHDLR